jgi:hypothetical protein
MRGPAMGLRRARCMGTGMVHAGVSCTRCRLLERRPRRALRPADATLRAVLGANAAGAAHSPKSVRSSARCRPSLISLFSVPLRCDVQCQTDQADPSPWSLPYATLSLNRARLFAFYATHIFIPNFCTLRVNLEDLAASCTGHDVSELDVQQSSEHDWHYTSEACVSLGGK